MHGLELTEFSRAEYALAKNSGMFWVWFPEATGNYEADVMAHYDEEREQYEREQEAERELRRRAGVASLIRMLNKNNPQFKDVHIRARAN